MNKMKHILCAIVGIVYCFITAPSVRGDTGLRFADIFRFNGYLKNLHTLTFLSNDSLTTDNLVHNRLNLKLYLSPALSFSVEIRNRLFYGEKVSSIPGFSNYVGVDNEYFSTSKVIVDTKSAVLLSELDRLWLRWNRGKFDITLGKQRINWGINTVWNPNDLFNVFNFVDFDYEERKGVIAFRAKYFTGDFSGFDLAIKPGKTEDIEVAALMYKFNFMNYDFQLLSGWENDELITGFGWAGNIKNSGFKGEGTFFNPIGERKDSNSIFSLAASIDYAFENTTYISGALLYNSTGVDEIRLPTGMQFNLGDVPLSSRNLMPGKISFLGQVSRNITPLFTVNMAVLYGFKLDLLFLMPTLTYSVAQNWDLSLVGQILYLEKDGGYENFGNSVFLRWKWSF